MSVKLSELKAGDVIEGGNGDCVRYGRYYVYESTGGPWIECREGAHYLQGDVNRDDHNTISIFTLVKDTQTMNDLIVTTQPQPETYLNEESITMLKNALSNIGDFLVNASRMRAEFEALKEEVTKLRREVEQANHFREIADQAYQQVNAQRIAAEAETVTLRQERDAARADLSNAKFDLDSLHGQLATATNRIKELEDDQTKLVAEVDETIASANAKANARVKEVEARMEEKDRTISDYWTRLDTSERDCRTLRQMLAESKKALEGALAVVQGTMAAE